MAIDRNKVIAAAQKYIQKGAYKKAIKEYSKIVREHPDDVRILLKVGDLQARDGQSESAAMTYNDVADHYVAHGFFLKAVAAYKLLLGVDPENFDAKLRLADLYFQLGLLRDALQNYQAVGAIFSERGWTDRYLAILDRVVEIDPEHAGNRIQLGEELARFNRQAEAAEHFLIAAGKLKAQGRFDEYTKVMERYVHLQPKDKPRILDLSRIYLDQGRAKRALVRLQDVFRDNPRDTETVDLLVRALAALGENDRAIRVLEDLAREYDEHGAMEARDTLYRRILEIDPEHVQANQALGGAAVMSFEVVGDGTPAPAADPAEIQKLLDETDVYLKYNLYEKALEHLNQIFALDPENLEALERRKTSLIATGQEDTAIGVLIGMARIAHRTDQVQGMLYLNQALAIRPNHPDVAAVMGELGGADMVPGGVHANTAELVEPAPAPSGEFAPPPIAEDVFDAFDMEDTAAGHEVLDEEFREEIADDEPLDDADGQTFVALEADEILPADLDEGLEEVDRMETVGAYDDARAHLFELLGQWPEHAEMLLRRMDALPSTEPETPSASELPAASRESAMGLFVDAEDDDHEEFEEELEFAPVEDEHEEFVVEPSDSVEFVADPADSVEFVADPAGSVEFVADPADSVEFVADPADSVEFVADPADSVEFVADASESGGFDRDADSDVGIFTIDDEPQPTGSADVVQDVEEELFDVDADMVAEEPAESYAHFAVAEDDAFESGAADSVEIVADEDEDEDVFEVGEPDALLDTEIVFVDPSQSASTASPTVETAPNTEEAAPVVVEEPLEFIDDEDDFPDASGSGPVVPAETQDVADESDDEASGGHDPFAALESLLASGDGPVTPTSKSGDVPRLSGSGSSSRLETSGQRMSVPEVARGAKRTVPPLPGFPSSGAAPVVDDAPESDDADDRSPVAALLSDSGPSVASSEVAAIAVAESDIDDDLEIDDVDIDIDADAFDDAPDTDTDLEPLEDVDDLEALEDIAEMDIEGDADALEPLETVDGSLENGADTRAMEAAQAAAARAADVDAPVGRASSLVAATFSPADALLESAPDSPLADAIRQRRDGNGMAAMFTLQEAEAGPNGMPASFELALANIEMGLFFEGISTLEQLLGQPDIDRDDRLLVHYFLGIAYEAMDQVSLADVNFRVVAESTPELYPDVFIRLDRIASGEA